MEPITEYEKVIKKDGKLFYCCIVTDCGKGYSQHTHLVRHVQTVHLKSNKFQCQFCKKTFNEENVLNIHLRRHIGEKPFQCNKCSFSSVSRHELNVHKQRRHTEGKPFKCEQCEYCAKTKNDINTHKRRWHLEGAQQTRFECLVCNKRYRSRWDLTSHNRTHTDEKPYPCEKCSYRARYRSHLSRHLGTVHATETPFQCSDCEFASSSKGGLNGHVRRRHEKSASTASSKSFTCTYPGCSRTLTSKAGMKYHQKGVHEKELRFACEFCGKGFYSKTTRDTHLKRHVQEKTYKCPSCPFTAVELGGIKDHYSRMHSSLTNIQSRHRDLKLNTRACINRREAVVNESKRGCSQQSALNGYSDKCLVAKEKPLTRFRCKITLTSKGMESERMGESGDTETRDKI